MKRYLCIWDTTQYYHSNLLEYHNSDYFIKSKGYTDNDINIISNMDIGDVYSIPETFDTHIIIRIKDEKKGN